MSAVHDHANGDVDAGVDAAGDQAGGVDEMAAAGAVLSGSCVQLTPCILLRLL